MNVSYCPRVTSVASMHAVPTSTSAGPRVVAGHDDASAASEAPSRAVGASTAASPEPAPASIAPFASAPDSAREPLSADATSPSNEVPSEQAAIAHIAANAAAAASTTTLIETRADARTCATR
jgi:hypothetical protein